MKTWLHLFISSYCWWDYVIDIESPFGRFGGTRETQASTFNCFLHLMPANLNIRILKIFSTFWCYKGGIYTLYTQCNISQIYGRSTKLFITTYSHLPNMAKQANLQWHLTTLQLKVSMYWHPSRMGYCVIKNKSNSFWITLSWFYVIFCEKVLFKMCTLHSQLTMKRLEIPKFPKLKQLSLIYSLKYSHLTSKGHNIIKSDAAIH